jgi:2-succinyl-5-enolpyruvyl-6-hydroxy-3-cyclohexene-1-carboxylate synthase
MVAALPPGALLFAGNSLPIRHLDQFGQPLGKPIRIFANRGASGIDGNISSALGAGASSDVPTVALLGDITFYHDMNGLLAVKSLGLNVTFVLLNNNGGGIFRRLPIANIEPPFTELFLTPHGLDFEPAIRMYGLDYINASDRSQFQEALARSLADRVPRVIEVRTDGARDHSLRMELIAHVQKRIARQVSTAS